MLDRLHRLVGRLATWPAVALLFIGYVLTTLGFMDRAARFCNQPALLDVRFWYSPAEVAVLFDRLGADGRSFYALTEVTLDLAFPIIYVTLLLILIYRLFEPKAARFLLLIPLVGGLADLLENISVATMAWTYAGSRPGFAAVATIFTLVKNSLVRLALVLVLLGALRAIALKRTGEEPLAHTG